MCVTPGVGREQTANVFLQGRNPLHHLCVNTEHQSTGRIWLPRWLSGKESACSAVRHGFNPWIRKITLERKWQPTPVFLPGEYQGQRSLVGYSPWGCKEPDMIEATCTNTQRVQDLDFPLPTSIFPYPKSQGPTILSHSIDFGHALLLKLRIKILWSSTHLIIKFRA